MTDKAIVVDTPHGIAHFRLLSIKGRVKLESKGIRHSSGAIRPRIAAEFGLKPRDSYEKYIAAIQAKIDASLASK
jgi:hypothetical protein